MNMTGLNVRKISNKLYRKCSYPLKSYLSQVRKRTFYMQGYFSSYPNVLAICAWFCRLENLASTLEHPVIALFLRFYHCFPLKE